MTKLAVVNMRVFESDPNVPENIVVIENNPLEGIFYTDCVYEAYGFMYGVEETLGIRTRRPNPIKGDNELEESGYDKGKKYAEKVLLPGRKLALEQQNIRNNW